MKLVLNPAFKELEPILKNLPRLFEQQGEIIYKSRNELRSIAVPGLTLNVKRYRIPIFINRIAYSFFRSSKASRAFFYALKLKKMGFGTPEPIAYLESKAFGLLGYSYFVSEHIATYRLMREFSDGSDVTGREYIIEALGVLVARMHEAGILHLDLSVGNIMFQEKGQDIQFWLVDLNRMRFCKIGQEKGCRNFERLRGNDDFFKTLAHSYAKERGFDTSECLASMLKYKYRSVQTFRARAERKQKHRKFKAS